MKSSRPNFAEKTGLSRRRLALLAPALLLPATALAALAPTPGMTAGPFYPKNKPADDNADLVQVAGFEREAEGDILHLSGRVIDVHGAAVAGARVEIWQCDVNGVYRHPHDRQFAMRDPAFQGFGRTDTGQAGRFTFRTIVPVSYPGRTPHIHVKVRREGKRTLTTQLYIKGLGQNAIDFVFYSLSSEHRRSVEMNLQPVPASPRKAFETKIDLVLDG
jgi:protocatechuate 3,4-dioxygenase beta subunit